MAQKPIYLAGKIFETEYVEQDIIVDADPKNKSSEFISAGKGKIKAPTEMYPGEMVQFGGIHLDLSVQEALKEEEQLGS